MKQNVAVRHNGHISLKSDWPKKSDPPSPHRQAMVCSLSYVGGGGITRWAFPAQLSHLTSSPLTAQPHPPDLQQSPRNPFLRRWPRRWGADRRRWRSPPGAPRPTTGPSLVRGPCLSETKPPRYFLDNFLILIISAISSNILKHSVGHG